MLNILLLYAAKYWQCPDQARAICCQALCLCASAILIDLQGWTKCERTLVYHNVRYTTTTMCYNYDKLQFRNSSSDFPQRPCNFHALSNPDPVNTLPQGMSMDHGGIMTTLQSLISSISCFSNQAILSPRREALVANYSALSLSAMKDAQPEIPKVLLINSCTEVEIAILRFPY